MTNVDLRSFLPIDNFFDNIGITINHEALDALIDKIKSEEIEFVSINSALTEGRKNEIRYHLHRSGCTWVNFNAYTKSGNDFLHLNPECPYIQYLSYPTITISSDSSEFLISKKRKCISCWH